MPRIDPKEFKYTTICWDVRDGVLKPYLCLCPDFIANEGFGCSLGRFFDTEQEAIEEQKYYELFFAQMFTKVFQFVVYECQEHLLTSTDRYRKEYFAGKLDDVLG